MLGFSWCFLFSCRQEISSICKVFLSFFVRAGMSVISWFQARTYIDSVFYCVDAMHFTLGGESVHAHEQANEPVNKQVNVFLVDFDIFVHNISPKIENLMCNHYVQLQLQKQYSIKDFFFHKFYYQAQQNNAVVQEAIEMLNEFDRINSVCRTKWKVLRHFMLCKMARKICFPRKFGTLYR